MYWSQVAGQRLNMGGADAYIDHADVIGSTTMETDPAGGVQWKIAYYPWGQILAQGGIRQSVVWAGLDWQVNDPSYPSATREYNDGLGRWLTPDPGGVKVFKLDDPQTWDMYAYVGNNPTSRNDPSGLCFDPASCSIELGAAGSAFGPIGTVGGAILGAAIGAGIGYYGARLANQAEESLSKQGMGREAEAAAAKRVPNPYGTRGAPDHQQTAAEEAAKIGTNAGREVTIPTPNGKKGSRRADAAEVGPDGKYTPGGKIVQVYRPTPAGNIPQREQDAAQDIENATGVKPEMVPVRNTCVGNKGPGCPSAPAANLTAGWAGGP